MGGGLESRCVGRVCGADVVFNCYKDVTQYVTDLKSQSLCFTGHIITWHVCCFFPSAISMVSDGWKQDHPDLPYNKETVQMCKV